ncbi:hypothetical protein SAMN05216338_1016101 [Bradyrhizobium sp. Rc2d]|nr:hypothetical protein SAMN05216338_1016101 [Bradyrhizobium sp. Rc2d]
MKPLAVMPQEANFSLIGRFGNCPFGCASARNAAVIRGGFGGADGPGRPPPGGRPISALGLGGGLHDLLLDEAKTSWQRAGAQQHGDAVGLFQGEVAGDLA